MKRRKIIKKILVGLLLVFIAIQFVPTTYNQSDAILETDMSKTFNVPEDIQNILKTSCYDCHSNNTEYPWYNKIQPVSWFLEDHIKEGKEELNFSEFGAYSKRRQKTKLKSIISQIRDNEMPLEAYTLIHRDAKLSENNKKLVMEWIDNVRNGL